MAFFDANSAEYENLSDAYTGWVSREYDIAPDDVDLQGDSEYAERFEAMLDILFSDDKPENWQDIIGELGFDAEWWDFYHDA